MTKNRIVLCTSLALMVASPLAMADLGKAGHEIKESAVEAADKTVEVGKEIGHATVETAKSVGHAVANGARKGYRATREAISGSSSSPASSNNKSDDPNTEGKNK